MNTERFFTNTPWEKKVAYCRAIKRGNFIAISGTTSMRDGKVWAADDAYEQARRCLEIIEHSLKELGSCLSDVVRTRMFVTDISKWEAFAKAHQEFFSENPPATAMYEIKSLIDPKMLIEIEVDAITPGSQV